MLKRINSLTGFNSYRRPAAAGGVNNLAFVNSGYGFDDTNNGICDTIAINHTTGNLIVVMVKHEGAATTKTISDTAGNSYTPLTVRDHSNGDIHAQMFYCANAIGNASNIVRVTLGANRPYKRIYVHQYSGAAASPFDQENFGQGSSTSLSTSNISTTAANEVLVAFACEYNISSFSPGANFTERIDGNQQGLGFSGATEDRLITSTGTYNATMSWGVNDAWMLLIASFKSS